MPWLRGAPSAQEPEERHVAWWPDWVAQAACRGMYEYEPPDIDQRRPSRDPDDPGPEMFFDYGKSRRNLRAARRVCWECPVREQCLEENLEVPFGMFGGYSDEERRIMRGVGPSRTVAEAKYFVQFSEGLR